MPEEQERTLTRDEAERLAEERLQEERRRFEAQLEREKAERGKAEELLRQREEELRRHEAERQKLALQRRAEEELAQRRLPRELISALRLDSADALRESLDAAERAFRSALESGVRERLRLPAPGASPLSAPAPRKSRLSYSEAARLYASDRAAYDARFGR